jgi:hypothetical protein
MSYNYYNNYTQSQSYCPVLDPVVQANIKHSNMMHQYYMKNHIDAMNQIRISEGKCLTNEERLQIIEAEEKRKKDKEKWEADRQEQIIKNKEQYWIRVQRESKEKAEKVRKQRQEEQQQKEQKEQERQEKERKEQERQDKTRQEKERKEQERQDKTRQEKERKEQEQKEQKRKEQSQKEQPELEQNTQKQIFTKTNNVKVTHSITKNVSNDKIEECCTACNIS